MIEASFVKQYGIRIRDVDMSYSEFVGLLGGLMHDTPLGNVVAIRSETDLKKINKFTPSQRKIYYDWIARKGNGLSALNAMQATFKKEFSKK